MKYLPSIGIETHVQLKTKSKLFCGCDNDSRQAQPNVNICPVCSGQPGSLPVLNEAAVELAVRAGLALAGRVAEVSKFDRKNYFYPDLPKGYQISQFDQPIIEGGHVEVTESGRTFRVGLIRAHLEEDAGKLTHPSGQSYSLLDLNRAGTPLLEIVSAPDMHSAAEAKAYTQALHSLIRYSEVSDADLYHGHMRFDVNVSLAPAGEPLGTRTETKNLNSFRSVERAVLYEIERQSRLLEDGESIVQETRGWDENKGASYSMRSKEEANDYRYFPEPDLPPIAIDAQFLQKISQTMPLPWAQIKQRLDEYSLSPKVIEALASNPLAAKKFIETVGDGQAEALLLGNLLAKDVKIREALVDLTKNQETDISKLISAVIDGRLSKDRFEKGSSAIVLEKISAEEILASEISDVGEIEKIVDGIIADNAATVADLRAGKEQALGFLVGQVMKASGGKANPKLAKELLHKKLL